MKLINKIVQLRQTAKSHNEEKSQTAMKKT